jgi:hypothetical protein
LFIFYFKDVGAAVVGEMSLWRKLVVCFPSIRHGPRRKRNHWKAATYKQSGRIQIDSKGISQAYLHFLKTKSSGNKLLLFLHITWIAKLEGGTKKKCDVISIKYYYLFELQLGFYPVAVVLQ